MTFWNKTVLAGALGASVLAFSGASALADIVCNGNTCWHVREHFDYPRSGRVVVHGDDWNPGPRIRFREHEGRGYWRGGSWITIR
jgi:hypothetical protein